jgi:hypothetical protein
MALVANGHGLRHELQLRAIAEAALGLRRLLVTEVGFEVGAGDEVVARVAWVIAEAERHAGAPTRHGVAEIATCSVSKRCTSSLALLVPCDALLPSPG